jgi:hypothetical protein
MSMRTIGLIAMAVGAILGVGRSAAAQDPTSADYHGRPYHIFLTGAARMTVLEALRGAIRRLSRSECQHLFEDFTDQAGRALRVNLATTAESPADFLAGLYFVEGDDAIQCRTNQVVTAFTTSGSRVIHVCSQRFLQFAVKTKGGEILLIHELLHALGLGENPPTSSRITNAVMNRCG